MSGQEILEGNKLIAEFMGYQILRKKYETQYVCSSNETAWTVDEGDIVCDSNGNEVDDETQEPYFELEYLPFNSSWDWLMSVVEKVENIDIRNNGYDFPKVKMNGDHVEIFAFATYRGTLFYWKKWYSINGTFHNHKNQTESKIEAVWLAVTEFIRWYNLQNDKHDKI